jgi:predicted metal-dependent phosphoesterase TrpH
MIQVISTAMQADLHCHSHYSDGQHSPQFLCQRAMENGISHLAITDHDFITWENTDPQQSQNLKLIPGVEISCDWSGRELHVVGLFIQPDDQPLQNLLSEQRDARRNRMVAMNEKLEKAGITGLLDFLKSQPCKAWTRSHVAQFLVDNGHCKNWDKAFSRFLSRKGKIYVPTYWCSLEHAIQTIKKAGGIAVLAHPSRYGLTKTRLNLLLEEFIACGGEAIEGSYGNIDGPTRKYLCELAASHQLLISTGSDFHDASRHWTDIGKFPALDPQAQKNAIWNDPRWHF